ncbi:MAG: class I SAM-dependent methyltransferase [Bacteroidales bacterium]|nr:class I SAM-dependent methyltransferase [Bacteroidales bacterium]
MVSNEIESYIGLNSSDEDPVLAALNRETHIKVLNPRMLSGHLQGKFLEIISKLVSPEYILEIGTFTGYSAICLAKGLRENGRLLTIDCNDELVSIQKKYIKQAGLENKIELFAGNAFDIVPTLNYQFDLVFIDADKQSYTAFYNLIIEKVKPGGIILADNVLWNSKVVDEHSATDRDTLAIKEFNNTVRNDNRVEVVIIPLRDGISLIRKL